MHQTLSLINSMKMQLEQLNILLTKNDLFELLSIYENQELTDFIFSYPLIDNELSAKIVELMNQHISSPYSFSVDSVENSKYLLLLKDNTPYGKVHKITKRIFLNRTLKEKEGNLDYSIRFHTLGFSSMEKDIQELQNNLSKYNNKRLKTKKVTRLIKETESKIKKYENFYLDSVNDVSKFKSDKVMLQSEITEFKSMLETLTPYGFYCSELFDNEYYIYFHHHFKENSHLLNGKEIILHNARVGFYEDAPIPESSDYLYRQVILYNDLFRIALHHIKDIKIIDIEVHESNSEDEELTEWKTLIHQSVQSENQETLVHLLRDRNSRYYVDDYDLLKLSFIYKGVYFKMSNTGHIITNKEGLSLINENEDIFNYLFGFKR